MNLIVDIGNTQVKLALFKNGEISFFEIVDYADVLTAVKKLTGEYNINKSIVSNVGANIDGLIELLEENFFTVNLDSKTPLPIGVDYETPDTLGVDRRALAVAVNYMNKGEASLVIDMGTCITFDFVSGDGVYRGGAISPGMNMRFKAMNNFTESLPLVSFKDNSSVIGKNTEMSMINGVVNGIKSEIDAYIDELKCEYDKISIFISGGDHPFFVNKLKNSIFADQKILLKGLNIILNYNFDLRNK